MKKTLTAGAILLATLGSGQAQDFFNGLPGPKTFQLDHYATSKDGNLTGTYIVKAFPKLGKDKNLLIAVPNSITDKVRNEGINLGYMQQNITGKNIHATAALGIFRGEEKYNHISPNAYMTCIHNYWTIDAQGSFDLKSKKGDISTTLGFGNDRIRGGASLIYDGKMHTQLLARYDIMKNHAVWVEGYASKKKAGVRLAVNLKK